MEHTIKKELGDAIRAQKEMQDFIESELHAMVAAYKSGDSEGVKRSVRTSRLIQAMSLCMKAHGKIRNEDGEVIDYLVSLALIIKEIEEESA